MSHFAQVDVTPEGRLYFDHWLADIGGLARELRQITATQGRVVAVVPVGTPLQRTMQFNAGGLTGVDDSSAWLYAHVLGRLKERPNGVLLNQDLWASAEDIRDPSTRYVVKDGVVYYYVCSCVMDAENLRDCLLAPLSFVTAMYVIQDGCAGVSDGSVLSGAALAVLASQVSEIIMPAYDQESFLVWTRVEM